ncbi:MAG: hypothetical protein KC496_23105, partial [Anaerolineae bacterium]|nr:hypothetical protein [Anaerolineae bacterium]
MSEKTQRLAWSSGANPYDLTGATKTITTAYVNGHSLLIPKGAEHATVHVVCDAPATETELMVKAESSMNGTAWAPTSYLGNQVATTTEVAMDILEAVFSMQSPTAGKTAGFQVSVEGLSYFRVKMKGVVGGATGRIF